MIPLLGGSSRLISGYIVTSFYKPCFRTFGRGFSKPQELGTYDYHRCQVLGWSSGGKSSPPSHGHQKSSPAKGSWPPVWCTVLRYCNPKRKQSHILAGEKLTSINSKVLAGRGYVTVVPRRVTRRVTIPFITKFQESKPPHRVPNHQVVTLCWIANKTPWSCGHGFRFFIPDIDKKWLRLDQWSSRVLRPEIASSKTPEKNRGEKTFR